jgi:hypothetical protein
MLEVAVSPLILVPVPVQANQAARDLKLAFAGSEQNSKSKQQSHELLVH